MWRWRCVRANNVEESAANALTMIWSLVVKLGALAQVSFCTWDCICVDNVGENAANVLTATYRLVTTPSAWARLQSCS